MQAIVMSLISRVYLILIGYLAGYFPISSTYPDKDIYSQGFAIVPQWFLDMWYRWDSGWYLNIIKNGYQGIQELGDAHAFFPLFPSLVRTILNFLPVSWRSDSVILLLGLGVANLCFVGGMWLLARLINELYDSGKVANYTAMTLAFFPTSYIFSTFYPESLFLILSVATYYFIIKERWYLVIILSVLLTLTRPTGVLILVPLAIELITRSKYKWGPAVAMLTTLVAFTYVGQSAIVAQQAWGKAITWPWETLLNPTHFIGYITSIDKWVSLVFITLTIYSIKNTPRPSFTWYGIAMFVPFLFTGTLQSATRYAMLSYPLIAQGSYLITKQKSVVIQNLIMNLLVILGVILFVAWVRFYWAG